MNRDNDKPAVVFFQSNFVIFSHGKNSFRISLLPSFFLVKVRQNQSNEGRVAALVDHLTLRTKSCKMQQSSFDRSEYINAALIQTLSSVSCHNVEYCCGKEDCWHNSANCKRRVHRIANE